jgi:hypothetical protein
MPSAVDILGVVGRVRRAMPRNAEVMFLCDCLERLILNIGSLGTPSRREQEPTEIVRKNAECLDDCGRSLRESAVRPRKRGVRTFDKAAYQREYMRRRREKERAKTLSALGRFDGN